MNKVLKLSRKKIAILISSLIASLIIGLSFCFSSQTSFAATALEPNTLVAEDTIATVLKDSTCVKRWQECTFKLYYLGDYEDICINEIHTAIIPTDIGIKITFSESNQITSSYSVSKTVSQTVTSEMNINGGINLENFLFNAGKKATNSVTVSYAETIGNSNTQVVTNAINIEIDGVINPANMVYGNLLMIDHACRYKLTVHKQQHAKKRSSAFAKWDPYEIEEQEDSEFYFFALNQRRKGIFYQKTGRIGSREEYANIVYNVGKI